MCVTVCLLQQYVCAVWVLLCAGWSVLDCRLTPKLYTRCTVHSARVACTWVCSAVAVTQDWHMATTRRSSTSSKSPFQTSKRTATLNSPKLARTWSTCLCSFSIKTSADVQKAPRGGRSWAANNAKGVGLCRRSEGTLCRWHAQRTDKEIISKIF